MKPEVLVQTIADHNDACAAGSDERYYKNPDFLLPLETPPFYGCRVKGSTLNWKGGIRINEYCEVCDEKGTPIPGLYAGGVVCAGFQGESYGYLLPASSQGISLATGRISGAGAAEYAKA